MQFPFTTESAEFLERPNRYLVVARLHATGEVVRAHCPDPGRLKELLLPGASVHLSRAVALTRKTAYTLRLVEHPVCGQLVSLDTCLANRLFLEGLTDGLCGPFSGCVKIEREVSLPLIGSHGIRSRIDYRLTDDDGHVTWVEVKSASLVEEGTAYFPDAVTERGRRHLEELQALVEAGERAAVCFVVQRPDAFCVRPFWARDPAFAQALVDAMEAGVECYAFTAHISLTEARICGQVPVVPHRPGSNTSTQSDTPAGGGTVAAPAALSVSAPKRESLPVTGSNQLAR